MRFRTFFCVLSFAAATSAIAQKPEEVAYFHLNRVKSGMVAQYETTRKQHWLWHKRLGDTWSYCVWQIVSGGESPQFLLLADSANWAAFAPTTDKGLDAVMEEAYGEAQGASILRAVRRAIRSQYVETWQYRADLSFLPAPK